MTSGPTCRRKIYCVSVSSIQRRKGTYPVERMRFDLREFVFHVIRVHGPYLFFGGCSEDFDDFHQLIDARFARE